MAVQIPQSAHGADDQPLWAHNFVVPPSPPLESNASCDVCVIGAGIAGLSTAYCLARAGRRVIVLDDGQIGSGQTERTSAHVTNAIDTRYTRLGAVRGNAAARLAAESHTAAIEWIASTVADEGIACDLERVDGYLFADTPGDDVITQELEAARAAGVPGVELVPGAPLPFATGPCIRFPRQAQFHPLRYLAGLAEAIARRNGRVCGESHVATVDGSARRAVTGSGVQVTADHFVIATNTPVFDRVTIHTKQAPYLTYVVGLRIARGALDAGLYWDTADPFHYVRLARGTDKDSDVLLVGGADHKTGQANDGIARYRRLEAWARKRFVQLGPVTMRWCGQVMETLDGLAYIGRNPSDSDNVFVATGDSGVGITHGTIAGLLLSDLIIGRDNPWAPIYDPHRVPIAAAPTFVRENLNVAVQYADWIAPGDVADIDAVKPGNGAIVRRGLKKIAVYRDEAGALHCRSAVCPHLGCVVAWNAAARSWDCPCHGSRFDCHGRVTNGPANRDLSPVDLK